jgi:hypothetical protein
MDCQVGKIYECFGTFVLCTGTKQEQYMGTETFQGVVVKTDGSEESYLGQYSDTFSSDQFKETKKKIHLQVLHLE